MSMAAAGRAEVTKQFTTVMWWVLAIVLAVYVAAVAAALGFAFAASATGEIGSGARVPVDGLPAALYSTATSLGYVFPVLIGTLMVTSEFRHQTLTPTFLATPRRGVVLGAKLAVGAALGVLYGVVATVAAAVPGAAFLAGHGLSSGLDDPAIWAQFVRMLVAYALWVLVGIGVGTVVRNQVGAIVGVLVFTQFLEPVARAAAAFVAGLPDVTRFLPGAAGDALVGASVFTVGATTTAVLDWWAGGLVLAGYAAVFVLLGALTSWRRDVT